MTLNIIFVLIIITHARGFESIRIFGGEGDLAAPYYLYLPEICTGSGSGTRCAGCPASGPGTGSPRRRRAAKTGDTWTAGGNHKIDNNLVISNQYQ